MESNTGIVFDAFCMKEELIMHIKELESPLWRLP